MSIFDNIENTLAKAVGEAENLIHHPVYPTPWYMAEVIKGKFYRGAWPSEGHLIELRKNGIRSVMNFCSERRQDNMVRSLGMVPHNLGFMDNTAPSDEIMGRALDVFDAGVGATFGHCEQGIGRTGCIVAGIRVKRCGWTPMDAFREAESYGLSLQCQREFILGLGLKK